MASSEEVGHEAVQGERDAVDVPVVRTRHQSHALLPRRRRHRRAIDGEVGDAHRDN